MTSAPFASPEVLFGLGREGFLPWPILLPSTSAWRVTLERNIPEGLIKLDNRLPQNCFQRVEGGGRCAHLMFICTKTYQSDQTHHAS